MVVVIDLLSGRCCDVTATKSATPKSSVSTVSATQMILASLSVYNDYELCLSTKKMNTAETNRTGELYRHG